MKISENRHIYVVFKTHFDIGFTDLAETVVQQYGRKMLPDVIKTCTDTQKLGKDLEYVWTMSSWPLLQSLKEEYAEPSDIAQAKKLIKENQLTWHALPFTTHTEFCGLEEYIRGIEMSAGLSREYDKWPLSAKMTDVPGHTRILPTLLAGAGVKFLHLGCNPGTMPADLPRLFWWQGPDGSRVLTYYSKGSYGTDIIPPEDWPYPPWLAVIQTNDNIGPQDADVIQNLADSLQKEDPSATITVGTMDDFYNDIIQYSLDIPTLTDDIADSWIHGVGTYPQEVSLLRSTRRMLPQAEALLTVLEIAGATSFDDELQNHAKKAYENQMLFGEHTWGLDVKTHLGYNRHYDKKEFLEAKETLPTYKKMEKSWDEKRARAHSASCHTQVLIEQASHVLESSLAGQGEQIVFSFCSGHAGSGKSAGRWMAFGNGAARLTDSRTGELLMTKKSGDTYYAWIPNPPAIGYLACSVDRMIEQDDAVKTQLTTLESPYYAVSIYPDTGEIYSLIDKETGREWVDSTAPTGFGAYQYDKYGMEDIQEFIRNYSFRFSGWLVNDIGRIGYPETPHETFSPVFKSIEVAQHSDYSQAVITYIGEPSSVAKYGDAREIRTTLTLPHFCKKIELEFLVKDKQETPYVDAIHFVFPIRLDHPSIRIGKLGGYVNPATDITADANNRLYCLDNHVDITNGSHGMTVVSHDIPLFSLQEQGIYQFAPRWEAKKPWLYFNACNTAWGTNFPQWIGGDMRFRFTLFSHTNDQEVFATASIETEKPVVLPVITSGGTLPQFLELIHFDEPVEILSFAPANIKEKGYILRLKESEGAEKIMTLFAQGLTSVTPCDLQQRVLGETIRAEGAFSLTLPANGIISLCLRFE